MSKGCVLDLRLDDEQGTSAHDYSRYGNNGAVNGGAEWAEQGMRFDGSSGYLDCGNDISLDTAGSLTHSFWMNNFARVHGDYTNFQTVVSKNKDDTNGSKQFYWYSVGNEYRFRIKWSDGSVSGIKIPASDAPIRTPHHITCVYDADLGEVLLYLNGSEVPDSPKDVSAKTGVINTEPLNIGKLSAYNGFFFNGIISDVRIYNRALSAAEIYDYYESTKHRYK